MGTGSIDATRLQLVGSPFNPVPSAYSGSPGRERPSPWPSHLHRLSRHFELALRHECHIPTGKHQAPGARVGTCSGRAGRAKAPAPRHPHAAPCPCLIFDLSCCPVPPYDTERVCPHIYPLRASGMRLIVQRVRGVMGGGASPRGLHLRVLPVPATLTSEPCCCSSAVLLFSAHDAVRAYLLQLILQEHFGSTVHKVRPQSSGFYLR